MAFRLEQYRENASAFRSERAAVKSANEYADKHEISFTIRKYRGEGFFVLVSGNQWLKWFYSSQE